VPLSSASEAKASATARTSGASGSTRDRAAWQPPPAGWLHAPAWLMSFTLHCAVFLALGLLVQLDAPRGVADVQPDRSAGIVLASASRGEVKYFSEEDAASGSQAAAASATSDAPLAPFPEATEAPLLDGPQLPSAAQALAASTPPVDASAVPGAKGLAQADGPAGFGKGHSYDVETGVFGVKGRGSKFVYVFDRSASMSGFEGRPLSAAKRELLASLESLGGVHQFQVIFYNQKPHLMTFSPGQEPVLLFANDDGKRLAHSFIRGVTADGGTNHMEALQLALAMRPDVIFFLTDADEPRLTQRELAQIRQRNRGTTICTVEYGAGPKPPGVSFLEELAEQNGGQHRYVDVTQLPRR